MKIKLVYRLLFSSIFILFLTPVAFSAEFMKLDTGAPDSSFEVAFLETAPQIDAILDDDLKALEPSPFNYFIQFSPGEFRAELNYRLAYGTGFLYLFITLDTDEFIVRDRGYQNGDGFVLLFNTTSVDEQKDNVSMLSFAPKGDTQGKLSGKIPDGSVTTMEFNSKGILEQKRELRTSDSCPDLRKRIESFFEDLELAEQGNDPLAEKRGYVRRAFRSAIDDTLQPYTIRIPDNYDKARKYAAIVFLHGSDSDDTAVERHDYYLAKGDVFVIAPNGRGPRTAYTVDHAHEDIGEAISDALENYNIDEDRLILAGYSMGGYGAYRTFYETPDRYKGVAVFSGHPSLAEEYFPGMEHPDFLQEAYLAEFSGSNFIIFHGRKDRNTQFELTDEFVEKLKNSGVDVQYFIDENVGHRPPKDKEILASYHQWLADTVE